ncbi:MAG: GTP-binding protein [Candidatus Lokiarchaeota archaeon]|nr:GTP-binding protein [Candidatus Lokiarchaeota archaeon]MBD3337740.1 GTP-binding protein [Candidatus Lokiarchaeota archaeon]
MALKYKIVLAGSKNVGKSSLIARFCDNIFNEKTKATMGVAFKRKKVKVKEGVDIELSIWDFAGEEKYRILFPSYLHGASAALICFDITRRDTFNDINSWVDLINQNTHENVIKILIPTKIDLEEEKQIDEKEAFEIAKEYKFARKPIFTSSKTGENVETAFLSVANEIMVRNFSLCDNCGKIYSKKLRICNYCGL